MGRRIVKQPNGKYAIYSTVVDDLIMWDATREEYIKFRQDELAKELEEIFTHIENGDKQRYPYWEWKEALDNIVSHHGIDAIKEYVIGA